MRQLDGKGDLSRNKSQKAFSIRFSEAGHSKLKLLKATDEAPSVSQFPRWDILEGQGLHSARYYHWSERAQVLAFSAMVE